MDLNSFFMKVVESGISLAIVEAVNIGGLIDSDNDIIRYAKYGAIWTLSDQLVDYYKTSKAAILEGQYWVLVDLLVWNSLVIYVLEMSGLADKVADLMDLLPANRQILVHGTSALMKVSSKMLYDFIDSYYTNSPLRALTHISSYISGIKQ